MPAAMNFWDVAAGILLAAGLIMGIMWGTRRRGSERPFLWICAIFAAVIVIWRAGAWFETTEAYAHGPGSTVHVADLYSKYGLTPPDHQ